MSVNDETRFYFQCIKTLVVNEKLQIFYNILAEKKACDAISSLCVCGFFTCPSIPFFVLYAVFGMLFTLRIIHMLFSYIFFGISIRCLCCWWFLPFASFLILLIILLWETASKLTGNVLSLSLLSFSSFSLIHSYTKTSIAYISVCYICVVCFASEFHSLRCLWILK